MENIVDVLCTAMTLGENKQIFNQEEGTELMCILIKAKSIVRLRAVKVLNHALSGPFGSENCVRFIDNQGLKPIFSIFMGKGNGKQVEVTNQDNEHVLEMMMSLFNNLKSDSVERIRLMAKFVENDYEKVDRLIELRNAVEDRLRPVEQEMRQQADLLKDEETQLYYYLERVEHGLFSLQLIDYTLAWLIMEDDGIVNHIKMLFARNGGTLDDIVSTLKEYHDNIGDDALVSLPENQEEGLRLKDVIVNLVNYILSID
jgi:beta-catenin-like protein 1